MRRISLFYYPIFFLLFLTFSSCSLFLHSKSNEETNEEKKDDKFTVTNPLLLPEDEVSQPLDDLPIPLSQHYFWGKEDCSYDNETKILKINGAWKGLVISAQSFSGKETFDASDYRYIKIEYSPVNPGCESNLPFRLRCDYSDGTDEFQLCERKRTVQYLRLNSEKKSAISKIIIWTGSDSPVEYKINSLCFTQNRTLTLVIDKGNKAFDDSISSINLVKQMGSGWNLGNTFDAHSFHWQPDYWTLGMETEFHWSKIETTPELLSFPKSQGYKTIRIPVTWFTHIVDDKYTIDPDWMRRVKQVVDWAIDAGYYVILNEHHSVHGDQETTYKTEEGKENEFASRRMNSPLKYADGYIVSTNPEDIAESERFLSAIWTQIGRAFNNGYDEHLIFETMNEPRNPRDYHTSDNKSHEWNPGLKQSWLKVKDGKEVIGGYWCDNLNCPQCLQEYEVLNEYNQVCLDAIRATGGNNAKRFVMIPGMGTGIVPALNKIEEHDIFSPGKFKMPVDSANDKLILTVHRYPQWKEIDGKIFFRQSTKESLTNQFAQLNHDFIQKGIPVVVGETGALRSDAPLEERIKCFTHLFTEAKKYGMSVIWWDCGDFAQINRKDLSFYEPELTNELLKIYNEE